MLSNQSFFLLGGDMQLSFKGGDSYEKVGGALIWPHPQFISACCIKISAFSISNMYVNKSSGLIISV